ncbi:MFS transporter [Alicyclobacillus vulcanalis]|uniref:MFS transporter, putative metabolite:H+ symporter n=1 Tax=Alicyclobacillus vulcanalis TaxID=252246 RepID=A0A1N7N5Z6_9BACL|nr:MFS transporter [Alicyclobacillus vulcanalis]SIS93775.1 MFS transporter, putative metabolite:H+ symporter [Alicyclobacillus vulcanalis]
MASQVVAARLNQMPLTRWHKRIAVIVGISLFFDLFDIYLSGVLGTVLTKAFHIAKSEQALLLSSAFLGMFIGSIGFNALADRVGRKAAFLGILSTYSVFTFIAAFSPNATVLIIFRFLAGLGIGALLPLCDVYLSEIFPAHNRGRIMAWTYTLEFCATPVEGFLARALVPTHFLMAGWRWLFVIGSVGAIIVWALQSLLPESPRWLESVGRHEEANRILAKFLSELGQSANELLVSGDTMEPKRVPLGTLFTPTYAKRTVMLWIFQILQTFGYYGFGTLVPLVLASKGLTITTSLTYAAVSFIGYPVGSLLSVPIVERMERKWIVVGAAFCMGVFGILFGMTTQPGLIMLFGFLYTLASNIFSNGYHIFQAEIYPTSVRATAVGTAYSLSRLMSGLMPFILLPVLHAHGATAMFSVVAGAMLLLMIDVGVLGPKTTGRALEDVNERVIANEQGPNLGM